MNSIRNGRNRIATKKKQTDDGFVKTESENVSKDIENIKLEISKLSVRPVFHYD